MLAWISDLHRWSSITSVSILSPSLRVFVIFGHCRLVKSFSVLAVASSSPSRRGRRRSVAHSLFACRHPCPASRLSLSEALYRSVDLYCANLFPCFSSCASFYSSVISAIATNDSTAVGDSQVWSIHMYIYTCAHPTAFFAFQRSASFDTSFLSVLPSCGSWYTCFCGVTRLYVSSCLPKFV